MLPQQFHKLVLHWFDRHGRKHLPWQQNKTAYRVWVSEIMLQQTQVNTVVPYFERFIQQFPDLSTLANAHEDEILHAWAGLGYYSRARNLHKTAKIVMNDFNGIFPSDLRKLQTLPGIGQSTAGAILSIAFNQPAAILDGNVKRVLARFHGMTQPINEKATENQLWALAEKYTSTQRAADYTQAMMDLGATCCIRGTPHCDICPLVRYCVAHAQGMSAILPVKKASRELPVRSATFLLIQHKEKLLLTKRPSTGIWGGLWSFPEISGLPEIKMIRAHCRQHLRITVSEYKMLDSFRHTFSHYHLDIFPVLMPIQHMPPIVMDDSLQIWYNPYHPESIIGLPKPIQLIMKKL
ncbi:MAG: A/G-specific adenine glycosylase [Gammaproteobacteria bacterium]|nr:A/G-specific adenine glycosylase [Gammaproteobacteria bacterium]MCW5583490.1 A/G-specific adenine glycosylase [Gammaproteobacteria bacterium]